MSDEYGVRLVIETAHVCPVDRLKKGRQLFVSRNAFPWRNGVVTEDGTWHSEGNLHKRRLGCRVCGQSPCRSKGWDIYSRFRFEHFIPPPDHLEVMRITKDEFMAWPSNRDQLVARMETR